jgi:hypothetical protein
MSTKAELEKRVRDLSAQLEEERKRHAAALRVDNCTFNMANPSVDETKIAIAKAVREGMKALQSLGGSQYGLYIGREDK